MIHDNNPADDQATDIATLERDDIQAAVDRFNDYQFPYGSPAEDVEVYAEYHRGGDFTLNYVLDGRVVHKVYNDLDAAQEWLNRLDGESPDEARETLVCAAADYDAAEQARWARVYARRLPTIGRQQMVADHVYEGRNAYKMGSVA